MQTEYNPSTKYALTQKGAKYSPRGGNMANNLSWQGVAQATAKGPATGAAILASIQASNPTNQGNAIGYAKYAVRNGWLAPVPATKGK